MKILIVDDSRNDRKIVKFLLSKFSSAYIFEAINGLEAVKMVEKEHFDIIFMDLIMPGLDGIETTKRLKPLCPNSMIIGISTMYTDAQKTAFISSGAEDFIDKPINKELFHQRMHNYVNIIKQRNLKNSNQSILHSMGDITIYFKIKNENNMYLFWEFFLLNKYYLQFDNINTLVGLIYNLGLRILSDINKFLIFFEEDEKNLYFKILDIEYKEEYNEILKHYIKGFFIDIEEEEIDLKLPKKVVSDFISKSETTKNIEDYLIKETINETPMTIEEIKEQYSDREKISAKEYVNDIAISFMDKIDLLEQYEESIDSYFYHLELHFNIEVFYKAAREIQKYSQILSKLQGFQELTLAIWSIADFLLSLTEESFNDSRKRLLPPLIKGIISDITEWRESIFIRQEKDDIHYLDDSLTSSFLQIKQIFEESDSSESEDIMFF